MYYIWMDACIGFSHGTFGGQGYTFNRIQALEITDTFPPSRREAEKPLTGLEGYVLRTLICGNKKNE